MARGHVNYIAHSLGAKRLTPARIEASIRFIWALCPACGVSVGLTTMKERTVCTPSRAEVNFSMSP